MCIAVPGMIKEIKGSFALVDYGGIAKEANIDFIEDASVGDYVIVHVGYAISKLSKDEAEKTLGVWDELLEKLNRSITPVKRGVVP